MIDHTLMSAVAGAGLVALGGWELAHSSHKGGESARFARRRELRMLRKAGGIPLGRHGRHDLRAELNASVALLGPSQSGKTTGRVVPAVREWAGPAIVLSVKRDVLDLTAAQRQAKDEILVFDPADSDTAKWSPVAASDSFVAARAISAGLLQIGQEPSERDRDPHWREASDLYLSALLLAAHEKHTTMKSVLSWIALTEQDEPREALERSRDPDADVALQNLQQMWKQDRRYQSSVTGTLSTALKAWQEPTIDRATSGSEITPQWLLGGPRTLYIVAPASGQRRLAGLFSALITHLVDGAIDAAQSTPAGRLDPPLLVVLDELANCAPLPELDSLASSGAGQGVLLLSVFQDYSQAVKAFGEHKARTIVANHRGLLVWTGTRDPATHEYLRGVLGDRQERRKSRTSGRNGTSTTQAHERRPLVEPHHLRQGRRGRALLVYGALPPVWTEQKLP